MAGIRRQASGFQSGGLLGELPPQGRLQAGVTHLAAATKEGEHPRFPNALALIPQVKQVAALAIVDQSGRVDRLRPPVEPVGLGAQELGAQRRGPDVGEGAPLGAGDLLALELEGRRLLGCEVEREAEVVVLVGGFALGRVGVDVVDVDVDRRAEELRGQAQIPGMDPGLLAYFSQGRSQESTVTRLDMAARREQQPRRLVADVQHPSITVNDDRAAGHVTRQRCTAGRIAGAVKDNQQVGQGLALLRVSGEVRLDGRTDVGAGGRHVITSGVHGTGAGAGRSKGYVDVGRATTSGLLEGTPRRLMCVSHASRRLGRR